MSPSPRPNEPEAPGGRNPCGGARAALPPSRRSARSIVLAALVGVAFMGLLLASAQHVHGQGSDGPSSYHCALAIAPGLHASPEKSLAAGEAGPYTVALPDPALPLRAFEPRQDSFPRAPPEVSPRSSEV